MGACIKLVKCVSSIYNKHNFKANDRPNSFQSSKKGADNSMGIYFICDEKTIIYSTIKYT